MAAKGLARQTNYPKLLIVRKKVNYFHLMIVIIADNLVLGL